MPRPTKKPPGQRQLRVGEVLRQALAEIFMRGDVYDPALESASITVSEVRVPPDLKSAKVYVMPLGGGDKEAVLKALKEEEPNIRRSMAKKISLKFVPRLYFKLDDTFEHAGRINALLHEVDADSGVDTEE